MKKALFVTTCLVALVCMSFAFTNDERLYKNLKVLPKNTTKAQMDSVMKHFTVSLGVKCNFCHVRNEQQNEWDFASDGNKHKLVARQMMTMTAKLNKKYFHVTSNQGLNTQLLVSCYTCHHGRPEPAVQPQPQQRPAGDTTARNRQ